jgi:hypothetical protein
VIRAINTIQRKQSCWHSLSSQCIFQVHTTHILQEFYCGAEASGELKTTPASHLIKARDVRTSEKMTILLLCHCGTVRISRLHRFSIKRLIRGRLFWIGAYPRRLIQDRNDLGEDESATDSDTETMPCCVRVFTANRHVLCYANALNSCSRILFEERVELRAVLV